MLHEGAALKVNCKALGPPNTVQLGIVSFAALKAEDEVDLNSGPRTVQHLRMPEDKRDGLAFMAQRQQCARIAITCRATVVGLKGPSRVMVPRTPSNTALGHFVSMKAS